MALLNRPYPARFHIISGPFHCPAQTGRRAAKGESPSTMDFHKWTEHLWNIYFSSDQDEQAAALASLAEDCSIIGTGTVELYDSAQAFIDAFGKEMSMRGGFPFQRKDYWCQQRLLGEEAALTYGGIHIFWEDPAGVVTIDMDTRFSIVFQRIDGQWRIVHIHHSVPDIEQMSDEFYAKTMVKQVQEARTAAERMEKLAQQDGLTGLINFRAFQQRWSERGKAGWLFLIDVDNFKRVNDTYGHIAGNHTLIYLANILRSAVGEGDLVCRMGGDEFLLLCAGLQTREHADRFARRVLDCVEQGMRDRTIRIHLSMGGTAIQPLTPLEDLIERADHALYHVKKSTKNGFLNL